MNSYVYAFAFAEDDLTVNRKKAILKLDYYDGKFIMGKNVILNNMIDSTKSVILARVNDMLSNPWNTSTFFMTGRVFYEGTNTKLYPFNLMIYDNGTDFLSTFYTLVYPNA